MKIVLFMVAIISFHLCFYTYCSGATDTSQSNSQPTRDTVKTTPLDSSPSGEPIEINYTAVGAIAAIVAVLIAFITFIVEYRRATLTENVDVVFKLVDKFESPEMCTKRTLAARSIRDRTLEDCDDVLDYFEMIAMFVKRKVLDSEIVWSMFSYWMIHYWYAAEKYISDSRKVDLAVWRDFAELIKLINEIEKREDKDHKNPLKPSKKEIDKFLSDEIELITLERRAACRRKPRPARTKGVRR